MSVCIPNLAIEELVSSQERVIDALVPEPLDLEVCDGRLLVLDRSGLGAMLNE
jgi:hypothetical protein